MVGKEWKAPLEKVKMRMVKVPHKCLKYILPYLNYVSDDPKPMRTKHSNTAHLDHSIPPKKREQGEHHPHMQYNALSNY